MANPRLYFTPEVLELCDKGWRPLSITSLLLYVLRSHYSDANNVQATQLQNKIWTGDNETGILIETVGRWYPQLTEKRPAVIVKRNRVAVLRQGINDRLQMGMGRDASREIYATYLQGSHTVFCIGGEPAETEILAAETYKELIQFGPKIRSVMNLFKFVVTEIGEMALIEEATENFVVPITIGYAFEEMWEIIPGSPVISQVRLNALTNV